MNPYLIVAAAVGGAIGSAARYISVSWLSRWVGTGFPWGTLLVNVVGSFMMGVLVEIFAQKLTLPNPLRVFLFVGILGGFTTFSTFSLDLFTLAQRSIGVASVYGLVSVALGVGGVFIGMAVIRWGFS